MRRSIRRAATAGASRLAGRGGTTPPRPGRARGRGGSRRGHGAVVPGGVPPGPFPTGPVRAPAGPGVWPPSERTRARPSGALDHGRATVAGSSRILVGGCCGGAAPVRRMARPRAEANAATTVAPASTATDPNENTASRLPSRAPARSTLARHTTQATAWTVMPTAATPATTADTDNRATLSRARRKASEALAAHPVAHNRVIPSHATRTARRGTPPNEVAAFRARRGRTAPPGRLPQPQQRRWRQGKRAPRRRAAPRASRPTTSSQRGEARTAPPPR